MNNIRATNKINEVELENALRSGATGASWHDEYKDSAYIFAGGLPHELTEGDVITIFSQFGEVMDINLPRDKETGKRRGFGFLMYEDQRSTVLAVDNLNGASILGRTLRVDHVKQYKHKRERGEDGEWKDAEEQSLNAAPAVAPSLPSGSGTSGKAGAGEVEVDVDLEDPMAAYFAQRRKEGRLEDAPREVSTSRLAEKEAKRQRKEERAQKRARKEERRSQREHGDDARRSGHREEDEGRHRGHRDERERDRSPARVEHRHRRD